MKTRQNLSRYKSLIGHIAIILLAECGLMYLWGRVVGLFKTIFLVSYGNIIIIDIMNWVLDCAGQIVCLAVPLIMFSYFRRNAFHEKNLPTEVRNYNIFECIMVFGFALAADFIAIKVNEIAATQFIVSLKDYSVSYEVAYLEMPYQIVFLAISWAIIPPIVEELVFRKTVCKSLMIYGNKTAVIISALLFALMHTSILKIVHTFVAGLFLGWLYVRTKKVIFPIILHATYNLMAVIAEVLYVKVSYEAYLNFWNGYGKIAIIFGGICMIIIFARFKEFFSKQEMLPDENGEEVLPLTIGEKVVGFFTIPMIAFVVAVIIQMMYYVEFILAAL